MTSLNFHIGADNIHLSMDTLSLSATSKEPFMYKTKYLILPHLSLVIAGTGNGMLIEQWMKTVQCNMLVKGIDHLSQFSHLIKSMSNEVENPMSVSSTVYHFGYSHPKRSCIGYAFRSKNDFTPEIIRQDQLFIKPKTDTDGLLSGELVKDFIEITKKQRADDLASTSAKRLGIGGEIHYIIIQKNGILAFPVHKFDTYDSDYRIMIKNLNN